MPGPAVVPDKMVVASVASVVNVAMVVMVMGADVFPRRRGRVGAAHGGGHHRGTEPEGDEKTLDTGAAPHAAACAG